MPFRFPATAANTVMPALSARPLLGTATWRVTQLLAMLCVLSLADLFFTIWAHRYTQFEELNPVANALLARDAIAGLVLMKVSLTLLSAGIFWYLRRYRRAEAALWAMDALYVLLMLRWSDYTAVTMTLGFTGA